MILSIPGLSPQPILFIIFKNCRDSKRSVFGFFPDLTGSLWLNPTVFGTISNQFRASRPQTYLTNTVLKIRQESRVYSLGWRSYVFSLECRGMREHPSYVRKPVQKRYKDLFLWSESLLLEILPDHHFYIHTPPSFRQRRLLRIL